ncbi:uncharacterized Zn finger protein (UPF0148 family) [Sphingopyxis italica]|uniref:Uncharacterized Zn finger protein (UPF0148 family) n=1 Tax=Sphingopyxis italica TaxID=1129133 RepID=A0A7X6BAF9_9SPHN|nr:zinc ribbon domain-containing protein [Sphingopyxis italica]NJB91324.1 uncharacterized Zn finger protein (UPF0148 family) [Sphingopyxis italica]
MSEVEIATNGCTGCGNPLFADAKFCSECGQSVNVVEPETVKSAVSTFAQGTAVEAKVLALDTIKNKDVQKVVAGAALGAVIAPAIPFVTISMGAVLGGGYVLYKRLTR